MSDPGSPNTPTLLKIAVTALRSVLAQHPANDDDNCPTCVDEEEIPLAWPCDTAYRAREALSQVAPSSSPLRQGEEEPGPRLDDLHRALARRVGQYRGVVDRVEKEAASHERQVLDLTEELSQMTDERDRAQGATDPDRCPSGKEYPHALSAECHPPKRDALAAAELKGWKDAMAAINLATARKMDLCPGQTGERYEALRWINSITFFSIDFPDVAKKNIFVNYPAPVAGAGLLATTPPTRNGPAPDCGHLHPRPGHDAWDCVEKQVAKLRAPAVPAADVTPDADGVTSPTKKEGGQ